MKFVGYAKYSRAVGSESVGSGFAEWKDYAFCVLATDLILPFTVLFMERTNKELLGACEEEAGKALREEVDARSLLRRWVRLNALRCCFPVLGTTVVLWSALKWMDRGLNDQDDLHITEFGVILFQMSLVARA